MADTAAEMTEREGEVYGATVLAGETLSPTIREIMELPPHLRPWLFEQLARWLYEHGGRFGLLARRLHEHGGTAYFADIKRGWDAARC